MTSPANCQCSTNHRHLVTVIYILIYKLDLSELKKKKKILQLFLLTEQCNQVPMAQINTALLFKDIEVSVRNLFILNLYF